MTVSWLRVAAVFGAFAVFGAPSAQAEDAALWRATPSEARVAGRVCAAFVESGNIDAGALRQAGLTERKSGRKPVWVRMTQIEGRKNPHKATELTFEAKRSGRRCVLESWPQTDVLSVAPKIAPSDQAVIDGFLDGLYKAGWKSVPAPAKLKNFSYRDSHFLARGDRLATHSGVVGHFRNQPYLRTTISTYP